MTDSGPFRRRRRALAVKAAVLLGSITLSILACEAALRTLHFTGRYERPTNPAWPWIVYDPVVGTKNQAGFVSDDLGFAINSRGLRGGEIERPKRPGALRIVCLGDSTTFGVWLAGPFQVDGSTAYPQELAKLLQARGAVDVEVINAGVLGYTSAHGLRQLVAQLLPLQPDVIIVRYGNNEHARGRDVSGWEVGPAADLLPSRAYGWELVRLAFHASGAARGTGETRAQRLTTAQFEHNLHRFVDLAHRHRLKLLFLDFPLRSIERGDSPGQTWPHGLSTARSLAELHGIHEEYQEVLRRVAVATGTPLLETAEQLRSAPTPAFTEYDLSHPNQAGAQVIARRLLEKLDALGWLTAATR